MQKRHRSGSLDDSFQPVPSASIGNDIIDLECQEPALHPRFVRRAFTLREQVFIEQHPQMLWVAWAAKESAYKALKRLSPDLAFVPDRFDFDYELRRIVFENVALPCAIIQSPEVVAVWCATDDGVLACTVHGFREYPLTEQGTADRDPSFRVREFAALRIAALRGMDALHVQFSDPHPREVPVVQLKGCQEPGLVSFSHHGRYVAFAYVSGPIVGGDAFPTSSLRA